METPTPLKPKKEFGLAQWKMLRTAVVLIVLGLIVSGLTAYLHRYLHHGLPAGGELSWGWTTTLNVLDHLGLGLFSVAILGFIMELRHMKEYFQQRIERTIIKREFIKTLTTDAQEAMQKQSLEAYFGVSELGKQGDFYDFYVSKIRNHIGGPFRQDTRFKTVVEPGPGNGFFTVTETISYICKKRGEAIQDEVCWTAELDEINEVLNMEITATKTDQSIQTYPFDRATGQCHSSLVPKKDGHGFSLSLKDYASDDGLGIKVEITYVVSRERPFSWTMPYLSHGFSGEIYFPDNLEIFVDLFGMDKSALPDDKSQLPKVGNFNFYEISHQGWLLPDDGFSFYFRPKPALLTSGPTIEINETVIIVTTERSDPAS